SASQPPSTSCLFDDSAHCEIYALSLHDALPIFMAGVVWVGRGCVVWTVPFSGAPSPRLDSPGPHAPVGALAPGVCASPSHDALRSEEHTSELQLRENLVCRLLLEKKKEAIVRCN